MGVEARLLPTLPVGGARTHGSVGGGVDPYCLSSRASPPSSASVARLTSSSFHPPSTTKMRRGTIALGSRRCACIISADSLTLAADTPGATATTQYTS